MSQQRTNALVKINLPPQNSQHKRCRQVTIGLRKSLHLPAPQQIVRVSIVFLKRLQDRKCNTTCS